MNGTGAALEGKLPDVADRANGQAHAVSVDGAIAGTLLGDLLFQNAQSCRFGQLPTSPKRVVDLIGVAEHRKPGITVRNRQPIDWTDWPVQ